MDPLNDHSAAGSRLSHDKFQNNQQNFSLALIAGIIAMIVSAIAWAAVTVITGYQIGWMAIGVGFLVGLAVRLGKGADNIYRYLGAGLALVGCLLGNYLTMVGAFAQILKISPFEALKMINLKEVPSMMMDMASPIDLLFYAIAIFQAYKIAVKTEVLADSPETTPAA